MVETIDFNDLALLEPTYLRTQFDPEANGLAMATLAKALHGASNTLRDYVMNHVRADHQNNLQQALKELGILDFDEIYAAQKAVIGVYFWEIVYRKAPDVYDEFSRSQKFPLDILFPETKFSAKIVVDVGCGTGKLISHLAHFAKYVFGVDPAQPMLAVATRNFVRHANVELKLGSFSSTGLASESVDSVVSNMAFRHTEDRGGESGLAEFRRILRPGGTIDLVVTNALTQDFLTDRGFDERVVPGCLKLVEAENPSLMLSMLYMWSLGAGRTVGQRNREKRLEYVFAPAYWKPSWTQVCLSRLAEGVPIEELFFRGDLLKPLVIPVYSWRKPI
jgi:ubiquinone/menaquinone biosynthesis C-methylase UbiE